MYYLYFLDPRPDHGINPGHSIDLPGLSRSVLACILHTGYGILFCLRSGGFVLDAGIDFFGSSSFGGRKGKGGSVPNFSFQQQVVSSWVTCFVSLPAPGYNRNGSASTGYDTLALPLLSQQLQVLVWGINSSSDKLFLRLVISF